MSGQNSWSEKYRPKTLDEIQGQEEVIKLLKSSLTSGLPNVLFFGPPGSGKTTSILAVARQLFKSHFKERILELNASNQRGIEMIRTTLKDYANQNVSHIEGIPDYKLIILDECDALTIEAQSALRRIMEDFTKNTRFCLICNYISKIIAPISSRCMKFRFSSLNSELINQRLEMICKNEGFLITNEAINSLSILSNGDLRYAIGLLQILSQGISHSVTSNDISNIAGIVPSKEITEIISECKKGNVNSIYLKCLSLVVELNYSADSILNQLRDIFIENNVGLSEINRCKMLQLIGEADAALIDKTDPLYTISSLLCSLIKFYKNL